MKKQYIFPEIEVLNVLSTEFLELSRDEAPSQGETTTPENWGDIGGDDYGNNNDPNENDGW